MFGDPNQDTLKWNTQPFGELTVSFNNTRKPVKEGDRRNMQGPYPYYGATGIADYVNDYRLDGTYLLISEDGKALEFRNYDIAFIASGKIWVNNHAHVVQCKEPLSLIYLQYYFKYLDITDWVSGIDQKKLNRANLDSIPIMVPPEELIDQFDELDDSKSMMSCGVEPEKYDEEMTSLQKAMWFVEWQANSIGMRIAMPQALFVQAVQEAYASASQIPRKGSYYAEVLEDTLHRVAQLFDVSDFIAKQRAIQLGWDVAAGTFIYIDGHRHDPFFFTEGTLGPKQSFVIDKAGLDKVCEENPHIKELLDKGTFIYLGYVVCINDERYVRKAKDYETICSGAEYELTDYAREHVDECCLIFNWESISGKYDDGGFYGQCYLSKDVSVQNRIEHTYDPKFESNQTTESLADQIAKYKAAFAAEDDILSELHSKRTFSETLIYHMDRKKITVEELQFRSGISGTTIKKYRAGTSKPDIENAMALFIGLNLPEKYCDHMLRTLKISLDDTDLQDKVYRVLIREHSDGNLDQWNEILREFGLSEIPNTRNQNKN